MTDKAKSLVADEEVLLDERRVAEILGVSTSTLQKLRRTGGGPPFIRVGLKTPRYAMTDVRAWIERRRNDK